jgi:cytochrome c oxidase subunit II
MGNWLGLSQVASAHGAALDRTLDLVHLLMFALFVGWGTFFAYVLVRFRRKRNPVADYVGVTSKTSTWLELAVAVAEGFLLVGLSMPLWAARVEQFPPASDSTVVHVVAQQFAWNVHYPGPDGVFGRTDEKLVDPQDNPIGLDRSDPAAKDDITTVNQLHLPVDKPAIVYLSSLDVIHSFNLEEMRVKQDVIPGMVIPVWFVPTVTTDDMRQRTGDPKFTYEIACAQLCGLGHYRMRGYLSIDTPAEYDAWIAEQEKQNQQPEDSFWK